MILANLGKVTTAHRPVTEATEKDADHSDTTPPAKEPR